jgi:hypothetical protein
MIINDLMTPGFLSRDKEPNFSNFSKFSNSAKKATNRKCTSSSSSSFPEVEQASPAKAANLANFELPDGCPLNGGPVPDQCRFHHRLLRRMMAEGAIDPAGGCPLLSICRLQPGYKPR